MVRYLSLGSILAVFLLSVPATYGQGRTVDSKKSKDSYEFRIGDELVTTYHFAGYPRPIFWPVNAPGGIPLTRNYPPPEGQAKDHPHQKSAWFCHGDVYPEGIDFKSPIKNVKGVDFWSEAKGYGKIVFKGTTSMKENKGRVQLETKNEWQTAERMKIMDERRIIELHDLGKARLIVVETTLIASVCPITFEDTKEGSFGIRINDEINAMAKGKGKIQNAEGVVAEKLAKEGDNKTWGLFSDWCDYSGPINGKVVGLAILADPKNAYRSAWHVRGYGLMAANPFGRDKHAKFPAVKGNNELVKLKMGEHLHLRYGMLLHEGDAVSGEVATHFKTFVALRGK